MCGGGLGPEARGRLSAGGESQVLASFLAVSWASFSPLQAPGLGLLASSFSGVSPPLR